MKCSIFPVIVAGLICSAATSAESDDQPAAERVGFITAKTIWPDWWGVSKSWMAKPTAGSADIRKHEIVSVWGTKSGCSIYYYKFEQGRFLQRTVKLTDVTDKTACTLNRAEVVRYSFAELGSEPVSSDTDNIRIEDLKISPTTGDELAIFGKPIPGLKEAAMENCDNELGLCEGKVNIAFWTHDGQHVRSRHNMIVFEKDVQLKDTTIKNSAKKLFPAGTVPKGSLVQTIRANVSWLADQKFATTSCNAMWLGDTTLGKPDKVNWGCNSAKPAWEVKYRILR